MAQNDPKDLPDVSRIVETLLNDIQSLQQMEQELFNNLETNTNLSSHQQQQMIQKINQLSNMRGNLYMSLNEINGYYENALDSSAETLKEQKNAINIVESELTRSKEKLEILEVARDNKIRLVEINKYFGDRYSEHAKLMKVVIFTLIPIILLTIIQNRGILSTKIYLFLLMIVCFIGTFFFFKTFISIIYRDNMNYDTYDWRFDKSSAPESTSVNTDDPWSLGNIGTCVGQQCCSSGQLYDEEQNLCVTENFTTIENYPLYEGLTKRSNKNIM